MNVCGVGDTLSNKTCQPWPAMVCGHMLKIKRTATRKEAK